MATESPNNFSTLSQTQPDTISDLIRRLRKHAMGIKNAAATRTMGQDILTAALVIEQQVLIRDVGDAVAALPANEGTALATLLGRIGYEDCTRFAATTVTYGDRSEADTIWSGVTTLQRKLAAAGFAPR
jgi:hypothetical protein